MAEINAPQYDYAALPLNMQAGMRNYLEQRLRPGGFLQAVLEGDLYAAVARADFENRTLLCEIVYWIVEWAPEDAYGSTVAVKEWIRGIDGP